VALLFPPLSNPNPPAAAFAVFKEKKQAFKVTEGKLKLRKAGIIILHQIAAKQRLGVKLL